MVCQGTDNEGTGDRGKDQGQVLTPGCRMICNANLLVDWRHLLLPRLFAFSLVVAKGALESVQDFGCRLEQSLRLKIVYGRDALPQVLD